MSVASSTNSTSHSVKYKPTVAPLAFEEISEVFEGGDGSGMIHRVNHQDAQLAGHVMADGTVPSEHESVGGMGESASPAGAMGLPGGTGSTSGGGSEIVFSGGSLNNWYYAATPSTNRHRNDSVNCSQGTRKSSNTSQVSRQHHEPNLVIPFMTINFGHVVSIFLTSQSFFDRKIYQILNDLILNYKKNGPKFQKSKVRSV